jgi:hypothetical protein
VDEIRRVVALVGSAGSLALAKRVLSRARPNGSSVVFLCYHRAGDTVFDWSPYVDGYRARPALEGEPVRPDTVYHPDRSRTMFVRDGRLHSQDDEGRPRPSIDRLLVSLAAEYGPRVHAFLLSGLGHDGVEGLAAVKVAGGTVFVQHPDGAAFATLPRRAIGAGVASHILGVDELVDVASRLASGETIPALEPR